VNPDSRPTRRTARRVEPDVGGVPDPANGRGQVLCGDDAACDWRGNRDDDAIEAFGRLAGDRDLDAAVPGRDSFDRRSRPSRQALGKDPEIETRVDPAILGGIKVRVGSRLFDASLKSKLDSLKFALKRA